MFKKIFLIFLFTILGLMAFSYFESQKIAPADYQFADQEDNFISINGVKIKIDIADDPGEQGQGLSGREYLAFDSGMLFIFSQPLTPSFWMKDMNFSLDLIWIDAGGKIVAITKDVSPATYPKTFLPPSPIKYVLEVNSGWSDENKIKVGDSVSF